MTYLERRGSTFKKGNSGSDYLGLSKSHSWTMTKTAESAESQTPAQYSAKTCPFLSTPIRILFFNI
jgi:hypothetical protein